MTKKPVKIFIVAGGTGGHIIPARCLAIELSADYDILFFGDKKLKSYIKDEDKFVSKIISSSQIKKSVPFLFKAGFKILLGIFQSFYFFIKYKPQAIYAFGGYATFPVLISAVIFRTKIILHEQNAHLGKVNRIFAKYANKIAVSFENTSAILPSYKQKVVFTGNPIRQEIIELNKIPYQLPAISKENQFNKNKMGYDVLLKSDFDNITENQNLFNILVIGGSGGSKVFSDILPKAFFNLSENIKSHISITQQCRKELMEKTFAQYSAFNINIVVDSFFEDMPNLIKNAHLIIARAGSSSVFEFCVAKKPMILVPFAESADNHQEKNASFFEENGMAIVVREKKFTINKMTDLITEIALNSNILKKMSDNCAKFITLNQTQNLANLLKNDSKN